MKGGSPVLLAGSEPPNGSVWGVGISPVRGDSRDQPVASPLADGTVGDLAILWTDGVSSAAPKSERWNPRSRGYPRGLVRAYLALFVDRVHGSRLLSRSSGGPLVHRSFIGSATCAPVPVLPAASKEPDHQMAAGLNRSNTDPPRVETDGRLDLEGICGLSVGEPQSTLPYGERRQYRVSLFRRPLPSRRPLRSGRRTHRARGACTAGSRSRSNDRGRDEWPPRMPLARPTSLLRCAGSSGS